MKGIETLIDDGGDITVEPICQIECGPPLEMATTR